MIRVIRNVVETRTSVVLFRLSQRDRDNGVYSLFIRTVGIIYWEKHVTCVQQSPSPKPTVITGQNTRYRDPDYNVRTSAVWKFEIPYSLRTARTAILPPPPPIRETVVSTTMNALIYLPKVVGIVQEWPRDSLEDARKKKISSVLWLRWHRQLIMLVPED